jgi:lysophospholipase L1-like esterase
MVPAVKAHPNVRLLIVGDGPARADLEAQAEKLCWARKKLSEKKPFEILFYGDSITAGWEASGCDEHAINVDTVEEMHVRLNNYPYLPAWAELVRSELARVYGYDEAGGAKITKINRAAGGSTADWGVRNAEKLLSPYKPDLVVIGFGMNDNAKDEAVYAGQRPLLFATDDYHHEAFRDIPDHFSGYVVVKAPELSRKAITEALLAGQFYASYEGPEILRYEIRDSKVIVETSPCRQISIRSPHTCGNCVVSYTDELTRAEFPLAGFEETVLVVAMDKYGHTSWTQLLPVIPE